MSFQPIVSAGGFNGWAFLKRTMGVQTASFNKDPSLKKDEEYFREKIKTIKTAGQLVSDRRLLKVALGAFGLDGDINNTYFIRRVLEDGTLDPAALANRLADKQYQKMSVTFGFGDLSVPATKISTFADKILEAYRSRQFEIAVGNQNGDLRQALNTQRELAAIAGKGGVSEDTRWFTVMGNAPLRQVFEKALGLPTSFGALSIDRQLVVFKSKTAAAFGDGTVEQFTDPAKVEVLIRKFLVRSEAEASFSQTGRGMAALQMLQQSASFARQR